MTGKRTKDEAADLRTYFLTYAAPDGLRTAHAELKALRTRRTALEKTITTTMVMSELRKPRETFVLARGDYRNKAEKVQPGVPAMLPPLPKGAPLNRLTLAEWLAQPDHPLTARVAVNRFWQMYFGVGLVKTQEDFGVQGEPPVHPELLDWLATEFVRTGWDVRALQRLIVTSSVWQSSAMSAALRERDPENRLLARGPRFRMPAEMIRDTALAVSGLINGEIGGLSVCPTSRRGCGRRWPSATATRAQSHEQSRGKDPTAAAYTFWKRTVPPASLATFDAPDREKCAAPRAHEHAAPGPRAPERSRLRRGGARPGAADARRVAPRRQAPHRARVPASPPRACRPARRSACSASCCSVSARRSRATAGPPSRCQRRRIAARQVSIRPSWRRGRW